MMSTLSQIGLARKTEVASGSGRVGNQSWTAENLCIESEHNGIRYYTTRWDALCPYIDVTEEMLASAPKPLIIYALPPEGPYGVPITDQYGLVDTAAPDFWTEPRRERKFRELDKFFRHFSYSEAVIPGRDLTVDDVFEMGGEHFANHGIDDREVAGFVDYVRDLDVLVLQVHDAEGDLVLTDVSILLPANNQVYGSFCQWNRAHKNRSPGLYACLLAARWTAKNGYRYYNLGPVGDYGYKSLFVTDLESIYGIALCDPQHPLALDETSPVHTDFCWDEVNQIYRPAPIRKLAAAAAG